MVETGGALRLETVDAAAAAEGLARGDALAAARVLAPHLLVAPADPEDDRRALGRLARAATRRWTPFAAPRWEVAGDHGLALDVTGCAHLFGGPAGLLDDLVRRLGRLGFANLRAAAAPSFGAAWALARFAPPEPGAAGPLCLDLAALPARLAPLPVSALRLDPAVAADLERLGLRRIGDLLDRAPAALARRFGPEPPRRLDQALGRREEPLDPVRPRASCRVVRRWAEPVSDLAALGAEIDALVLAWTAELARRGFCARRAALAVERVDGSVASVGVATLQPSADPAHWRALVRTTLERTPIDPGFGVEAAALTTHDLAPPAVRQGDLLGAAEVDPDARARVLERLAARFGPEAVSIPVFRAAWAPEAASGWAPVFGQSDGAAAPIPPPGPARRRPVGRLTRPEPAEVVASVPDGPPRLLRWRGLARRVTAVEGPERLLPPWWTGGGGGEGARGRDYFHVETAQGDRLWLYREDAAALPDAAGRGEGTAAARARWFVHGGGP